jgi:hypothetical protein
MSETKQEEKIQEKEPTLKDFPLEWQIIVRATQSLVSKAKDGADINMLKTTVNFIFDTKKTSLAAAYDKSKKVLEIMWKKYRVLDFDERETIFIKTYEKRMSEEEALELISAWYEKIMYHIENRSYATEIYRDFYKLYDIMEWRKEAKQ